MNSQDKDEAYIAWRIIDCCLRENLRDIVRQGDQVLPAMAMQQACAGGDHTSPAE